MGNKHNRRRVGQRVRSEISRKPKHVTAAQDAFLASLPKERLRKENERRRKKPTKAERRRHEKLIRRWRLRGPNKVRKPRTNYGATYRRHSLDN